MKKLNFLLLLCLVLIFSEARAVNKTYFIDGANKSISLSPKAREFTLALKSNPTTGFMWQLKSYDHAAMQLLNHHYQRLDRSRIGAPGIEFFTFQFHAVAAHKPQQGEIHFSYARPWEKPAVDACDTVIRWRYVP